MPTSYDDPRRLRRDQLSLALEQQADPIARRDFLTRMGAALALAGIGGCTRAPAEEIVPYVVQPMHAKPGVARHYATASTIDGYAIGILAECHEGRPTKIEGNPEHPASLGAAGAFEQASVLSLYDPARSSGAKSRNWEEVTRVLRDGRWMDERGQGLCLLLEPTSSPSVAGLLDAIRTRLPRAVIAFHSAIPNENVWQGARLAFGRVLEPRLSLERAEVIVSLDSDFLAEGPSMLRLARAFAERRDLRGPRDPMNRLYVVEPLVSITGMNADHRLRVRSELVLPVASALAAAVGLPARVNDAAAVHRAWIDAVARDLLAHRGRSLVVAGAAQPPEVHALAHAINDALGNVGVTVELAPSPIYDAGAPSHRGLDLVTRALAAGEVDTLVVCGCNPVYTSAPEPDLAALVARTRQSLYLGLYDDETSAASKHVVSRAHELESWGDARAFDGTISIVQPMVAPLFGGRTLLDVLALLTEPAPPSSYEIVRRGFRATLRRGASDAEFEQAWRRALRSGVVHGSALPPVPTRVAWKAIETSLAQKGAPRGGDFELVTRADPHVHDGRFANNAWLLECPEPMTKLTWTNAATLARESAEKLGVRNGDVVRLRAGGHEIDAPAMIVRGQAEGTVGLTLGWGRRAGAALAQGRGANAFVLAGRGHVQIEKTGGRRDLPITQPHRRLEGRDVDILQHGTRADLESEAKHGALHPRPVTSAPLHKRRLTLYEVESDPSSWQWAMAIDLSRCTGCGACVIACQAENNVPTVGPDNVVLNREMHWLRVDVYELGEGEDAPIAPQPMLCQHCEMAPCEYVCPVNATVHSSDGLNEMIYNRCVGTRFCSNNCPYKIRRFNWFDFHRHETKTEQLVHNPDVTVRERGVMEKCTFCVQRIRRWEIKQRQGKSPPAPRTACQQTCPTGAIVFGDLGTPNSEVRRLQQSHRAYGVLDHLGTEPRVRYLARIKNPNPELGS